ncbi:esterase/lipase family protein [Aeromicrobium stalagmiti]|uniref:esterase/lipase family protein n=1 Tax=Aeromicrobium stalagmiti TaxID=2738988 RepID=UPI00156983F2|nr:alpha/beta fold hydrolase [Aeromicrobium stalagmiti]NRQ49238.1 alpha/beta fold hydrolase [Aeromicrobium stalagmiti]
MTIRRLTVAATSLLLALGIVAASPAQAAKKPLPVPYTFLTSAVLAGLGVDADPPGANDWSCKPSARHPRPVVLVHGLTGNKATNWQTFAPLLKNEGYCVFALTYGQATQVPTPFNQVFGGLQAMEKSAAQLKTFVARVRSATGSSKVDILGHSEGTVVPNYYAKFLGGAKNIHAYVSIAPLWHGTNPAGLDTLVTLGTPFGVSPAVVRLLDPYFASGPQLLKGSAFFAKLRSGGTPVVKGIRYTNIVTRYDELVVPYTSGIQKGMTNLVVQDFCSLDLSEHFQIVADPVAAALVLNALDPAHPRPVPCRLVLPFVGTL